ncbi:MAG: peptidylprolyl isomerase [Pirellulaceae bacterium]
MDLFSTGLLPKATALLSKIVQNTVSLTLTRTAPDLIESSNILVTDKSIFQLKGKATPGAQISVARDGDSQFNDGTGVADENGDFSIDVSLLNNATNRGRNTLVVQATGTNGTQKTETLSLHYAVGDVVRFATSSGNFDFELLNDAAPNTVQNFLSYLQRYGGTIIHRSKRTDTGQPFIVQGGGFDLDDATNELSQVVTSVPIANEFNSANRNLRGTLAMALPPGNINGATSQWFINMSDANTSLDALSFVVFGRIIGDGMTVVDSIHNTPTFDLASKLSFPDLTDIPLLNYTAFSTQLPGTVTLTADSRDVVGVGTNFTQVLKAGERIRISGQEFIVANVVDDTNLTLATSASLSASSLAVFANANPTSDNFVKISSISTIL